MPEAVSRSLKEIAKQGAICLTRSTIEVRLPWVVANLAQMISPKSHNSQDEEN